MNNAPATLSREVAGYEWASVQLPPPQRNKAGDLLAL